VLDNVDPETIAAALAGLDLERTLFLVTSKSGGTAETMAQYLLVRGALDERLGAAGDEHLVFSHRSGQGLAAPDRAAARGITALDIPAERRAAASRCSPRSACCRPR
jgi:glucose-6-phosphate isomerase